VIYIELVFKKTDGTPKLVFLKFVLSFSYVIKKKEVH